MGCLIQIGGVVVGFILCIVAGRLLHTITGSLEVAVTGGLITFAVCICLGSDYSSKFNLSQRPDTKSVNVHYTNSKGTKRNIFVNQNQVQLDGNKVILEKISGGSLTLNRLRIHNPEVLGLTEKETPLPTPQELPPLPAPQKLPKPIKIEEGPPILEPEEFIVGDMSGTELLYTRSDGSKGVIYFDPDSLELTENRAVISPHGTNEEYAILLEKIINPEVLHQPVEDRSVSEIEEHEPFLEPQAFILGDDSGKELLYIRHDGSRGVIYFDEQSLEITGDRVSLMPKGLEVRYTFALDKLINPEAIHIVDEEDDEPPILEPAEFIIGDMSGKELLYVRNDGNQGVIYFDPESVKFTDNRALVSPYGTDEEYAILLEKILNPEILSPQPRTPVIPQPVPVTPTATPQFETGVRVIIEAVPLDSYEAAQIMRRLKPDLGPFEVLEVLKYDHETILQGYDELRAKDIKTDLEEAGCMVNLQTIDESGIASSVLAPKVEIKTSRSSEPYGPWEPRRPQEHEFERIRYADGSDADEIKSFIKKNRIDVSARDEGGHPLIFGVRDPEIMGILIDMDADIHAIYHGNVIHHAASGFSSPEVMEMLIQFGVDFDAEDSTGQTPLISAAEHGEYEMAKILVKHGANIHHVHESSNRTALQAAQMNQNKHDHSIDQAGCEKIITLLREHGARESR